MALTMRAFAIFRQLKNTFRAPLLRDTVPRSASGAIIDLTPLRNTSGDTLYRKIAIITFIASLLLTGGPFAVAVFVVSVIINPFKRVLITGTATNIIKKFRERVIKKVDAALPVIFEFTIVGIIAPLLSGCVNFIFNRSHPIAGFSVGSITNRRSVSIKTSARLNLRFSQSARGYRLNRSAGAFTPPPSGGITFASIAQNNQTVKRLSRQVNEIIDGWVWLKNNVIFRVVHSVFSVQKMVWIRTVERLKNFLPSASILPQMEVNYGS